MAPASPVVRQRRKVLDADFHPRVLVCPMSFFTDLRREVKPFEFFCSALGIVALLLTLPFVVIAGGRVEGWAIGAVLWLVMWAVGLGLSKFAQSIDGPQAIGIAGMSFMVRAWVAFGILFLVAAKYDRIAGLTAATVFAAAFTFDLAGRTMLNALKTKSRQQGVNL